LRGAQSDHCRKKRRAEGKSVGCTGRPTLRG
jgi:hypothetical protein